VFEDYLGGAVLLIGAWAALRGCCGQGSIVGRNDDIARAFVPLSTANALGAKLTERLLIDPGFNLFEANALGSPDKQRAHTEHQHDRRRYEDCDLQGPIRAVEHSPATSNDSTRLNQPGQNHRKKKRTGQQHGYAKRLYDSITSDSHTHPLGNARSARNFPKRTAIRQVVPFDAPAGAIKLRQKASFRALRSPAASAILGYPTPRRVLNRRLPNADVCGACRTPTCAAPAERQRVRRLPNADVCGACRTRRVRRLPNAEGVG
jgi:hypothetical protein